MVAQGAVAYTATALLFFVVPLGTDFPQKQLGSAFFAPDNLLNAGILEWGRFALAHARNPFDWPAGYPVELSLAGTENLLAWQALYTPLRAVGLSVAAVYNIAVIASFVASGVGAERLARHLQASPPAARLAGLFFAFSHYHTYLLIQFQSLTICLLPASLLCLDRFLSSARWSDVLKYASVLAVMWLAGVYYALFALLIGAGWFAWCVTVRRMQTTRRLVGRASVIALLTAIVTLPVTLPYLVISRTHGLVHPIEELTTRSLSVVDFAKMPSWLSLYGDGAMLGRPATGGAFPGLVMLALCVVGLGWPRPKQVQDVSSRALFCFGAACVVLSLGPYLKIFDYPTGILGGVPLLA